MKFFSKEEDEFLRDNYLTIPAKRMAKMLGRCESSARQRMTLIGIIVPADITAKFKRESRFSKGHISFNKGLQQSEYMNDKAIEKTKATRFNKGHLPHNTKTDLTISVRPDNRGVNYKFIRVGLGKWIPLHRYNWEQSNGLIPAGMKLIFKDGDTMNCEPNNIEAVTPGELMRRNSYHNWPKPLAQTVQLRGALNRQINKHLKKLSNEK